GAEPGAVFPYLGGSDQVLGCPKNKRRSSDGSNKKRLPFPGPHTLDTDFSIVGNASGARLSGTFLTAYDPMPQPLPGPSFVETSDPARKMQTLQGGTNVLPVFVEEHEAMENTTTHDGRFLGDLDQLSQRHGGRSNISMLDGSVVVFKVPAGPNPAMREDTDFVTTRLYFMGYSDAAAGRQVWVQNPMTGIGFGWINSVRR
ncbi:MAG: hypothetical protein K2Q20_05800, partial [Phycisphaerales bacterium]|nr:hypothetical protein [Phycisphaerales bacterium]